MANNTGKRGSSDKVFNIIITVVMIGVIGLSVYAIYSNMSEKIISEQIASGEREATLEYIAEQSGTTVDEFLAQYGLADSGLTKKSTQTEVIEKMTLTNYAAYVGTTVDELLASNYLEGKATGDTLYSEFKNMITVKAMIGADEEQLNQLKEYYGLDDSITMDTLWSDVEPIIEAKMEEMQNATPAPTEEAKTE